MASFSEHLSDDEGSVGPFDRSSLQASLAEALAAATGSEGVETVDGSAAGRPASELDQGGLSATELSATELSGTGLSATELSGTGLSGTGKLPLALQETEHPVGPGGDLGGLDDLDGLSLRGWGRPTAHRDAPHRGGSPKPEGGGPSLDDQPADDGRGASEPRAQERAQQVGLPAPVRAFAPTKPPSPTEATGPARAPGAGSGSWFQVDGWSGGNPSGSDWSGEDWASGDWAAEAGNAPAPKPAPITRRGPNLAALSPETAALLGATVPSPAGPEGAAPEDPSARHEGEDDGAETPEPGAGAGAGAERIAAAGVRSGGSAGSAVEAEAAVRTREPRAGDGGSASGGVELGSIVVDPGILAESPEQPSGLGSLTSGGPLDAAVDPTGGGQEAGPAQPVGSPGGAGPAAAPASPGGPGEPLLRWSPEADDILPTRSIMTRALSLRRPPAASRTGRHKAARRGDGTSGSEVPPGGQGVLLGSAGPAPAGSEPSGRAKMAAPAGWEGIAPAGGTPSGVEGRSAEARRRRWQRVRTTTAERSAPAGAAPARNAPSSAAPKRAGSASMLNRPLGELFKRQK